MHVLVRVRADSGADTGSDGAGIHTGEDIHLYHRGLPLALISQDGDISWYAEYDEWGNVLREDNPSQLEQLIRLPGQQYDEESGLHYNRHRYYNPGQGRYITQDPVGLAGGWNLYKYPLNPVSGIDPLGLKNMRSDGYPWRYGCGDESTDRFVPDSLGAANFLPACGNHDTCYGTLGSDKATCDANLGADMKLACKNDLTGLHKLYRPVCNGMAIGYEFAVSSFGDSAFTSAQKGALYNYRELEMLDFLKFELGEEIDPDYHSKAYYRVANPR
ncbi:hypothetical protein DRF02_24100 [Salmonella enterica subsp. salamae]|nr:hypothetical protein [Salmonella enterica subsp. salamae]